MNQTALPLFWWLRRRAYNNQPHAYVCPFLMTVSAIIWRLRGKAAYWTAAYWGQYWDEGEIVMGWVSPARVVIGHCEARCLFSRQLIETECGFWNSRIGLRLRG